MSKEENSPSPKPAIVEAAGDGGERLKVTERELQRRIRQQELLAELGVLALHRTPFIDLLNDATRLVAEGLNAEFCKVLEFIPSQNRLLLRAGIGWKPELIGTATVDAGLASPSGFALRTGKPVISNHLEKEERFRTPDLLAEHGVRRAMNVILQGDEAPYGVLEVDSREEGEFTKHDIAFLQGAANILGMAIERQRYDRRLQAALEHQQVLIQEINHRVKNSLQIVVGLLTLQSNAEADRELTQKLNAAASRIAAIARAHERLYKSANIAQIELAAYLSGVCHDLNELSANCDVRFEAKAEVLVSTDRAIRMALLVTELITNAIKYAYPRNQKGSVAVSLSLVQSGEIKITIRDEGVGVPESYEIDKSKGLGMRISVALAEQLGAKLSVVHQRARHRIHRGSARCRRLRLIRG